MRRVSHLDGPLFPTLLTFRLAQRTTLGRPCQGPPTFPCILFKSNSFSFQLHTDTDGTMGPGGAGSTNPKRKHATRLRSLFTFMCTNLTFKLMQPTKNADAQEQ